MNTKKRLLTQTGILAAGAMLAAFLLAPNARANPVEIGFNGAGGTGHALLNVVPDTTAGDPSGAQLVMGASGSFSNSAFGTVSITGVRARNFATPFDVADGTWQPGMLPFPASFSQLAASGTSAQDNGVITYDDLFYADGSPQTCWDYPFFGGFLDPYGVMFSLSNGGFLDLWSFGVVPPDFFGPGSGGLTYGMAVLELTSDGGYAVLPGPPFATASVPEPDLLWLFGAAMLGLFAWRRSVEKKRARIAV
ncbi:MAG: PEP-CTERM sorting domain-containing protein [Rhodanobacteraceae bacterium]|nr:MAG: PEP-CTERM sorting domain-containing protein [Rhodanobacteraceae bacterium]